MRDDNGAVVGIRDKAAKLNEWKAEPLVRDTQQTLNTPALQQAGRDGGASEGKQPEIRPPNHER